MPLFGELNNLQELDKLDQLEHIDKLDQLQRLDQLEQLDKLDNLDQLQQLDQLDKLNSLDNLQQLQSLDKLGNAENLQQLQHLDQLGNMQALSQLQNLSALKDVQGLSDLQHLDHLQQLAMLQRLEKLESLNGLTPLQELRGLTPLNNLDQLQSLNQLSYTDNLAQLTNLSQLDKLAPLRRLQTLDQVWDFNYASLLYLSSVLVPGLIFQEAVSIFLKQHLGLKRALVLMSLYNVVTLMVCLGFVYHRLTLDLLSRQPVYYYSAWALILLILPVLLGALVAFAMRRSHWGSRARHVLLNVPAQAAANAWDRFLSEAENYQIVITLKNDRKILGTFSRGMAVPPTSDPNDLYVCETSHYDPETARWESLQTPSGIWVKGTEIKTVEVTPQP